MDTNELKKADFAKAMFSQIDGYVRDEQPDDYKGEDGLIYCGKCHTRKQMRLDTHIEELGIITVSVTCDCRKAQIAQEDADKQREKERQRVEELKKASLIDEKFRDSCFANFQTTDNNAKIEKIARRYVEKFSEMQERNQGLLFFGPPGTGKSYTAACIANELLNQRTPLIMTSFVKLLSMIKMFGDENEDEERIISRLNTAHLLIIDDLGAERGTDYALEKVYNIIDSRYRSKRPMILTTNLSLKQMQDTTDIRYMRIYDRIFEVCYPVEFRGDAWRFKEAKKRFNDMSKLLLE